MHSYRPEKNRDKRLYTKAFLNSSCSAVQGSLIKTRRPMAVNENDEFAFFPTLSCLFSLAQSVFQMSGNFPVSKLKKRKKNSLTCVYDLRKRRLESFTSGVVKWTIKEIYQKGWCTCSAFVLLTLPLFHLVQYQGKLAMSWYRDNFLPANTEKFQKKFINPRNIDSDEQTEALQIEDQIIANTWQIKLHEVEIDDKLNFTSHISNICIKASQKVGVLLRLRNLIPCKAKLIIYKSSILPHWTYYHLVWHNCRSSDSRKIERIQERALWAVFKVTRPSFFFLGGGGTILLWSSLVSPPLLLS